MKKLISLIISAMMLFSITASGEFIYLDDEAGLLSALSIMKGDPGGNMRYGDKVSRAECAKIVVAASSYRDSISTIGKVSPFKDVTYSHWASPYVTVGIKNGLFKGYFDATFRPSNTVLFEEAVTMLLRVLGYTDEDFGSDWPDGQVDIAKDIGLLDNVTKSVGQELTRKDISTLVYNTLITNPKGSESRYLSAFNKIIGPKTVLTSDWYTEFGADSNVAVMRDGVKSSVSNVRINDIAYYLEDFNTVLVYSKKVTGIYESATPNKDAPTDITVSGVTYKLEGVTAFSKVSSSGAFEYGDTVTLLLGKSGEVADVSVNSQLNDKVNGFLSAVGTKQTTVSGTTVTKPYVRIVLPSGEACEYITNKNYDSILNCAVSASLEGGIATLSPISSNHGIKGEFVWGSGINRIGTATVSDDVKIIETSTIESSEKAIVASVYPQRLNGITLSKQNILYLSKDSAGHIDALILNDATGDTYTYGILTSAKNTSNDFSLSGSYEYISNGTYTPLVVQNKTFSVSKGQAVKIQTDGKNVLSMTALNVLSSNKITDINGATITLGGKTYTMSDKVQVYMRKANPSTYNMITLDELKDMAKDYQAAVYIDKPSSEGGRVRIIVIS